MKKEGRRRGKENLCPTIVAAAVAFAHVAGCGVVSGR